MKPVCSSIVKQPRNDTDSSCMLRRGRFWRVPLIFIRVLIRDSPGNISDLIQHERTFHLILWTRDSKELFLVCMNSESRGEFPNENDDVGNAMFGEICSRRYNQCYVRAIDTRTRFRSFGPAHVGTWRVRRSRRGCCKPRASQLAI